VEGEPSDARTRRGSARASGCERLREGEISGSRRRAESETCSHTSRHGAPVVVRERDGRVRERVGERDWERDERWRKGG